MGRRKNGNRRAERHSSFCFLQLNTLSKPRYHKRGCWVLNLNTMYEVRKQKKGIGQVEEHMLVLFTVGPNFASSCYHTRMFLNCGCGFSINDVPSTRIQQINIILASCCWPGNLITSACNIVQCMEQDYQVSVGLLNLQGCLLACLARRQSGRSRLYTKTKTRPFSGHHPYVTHLHGRISISSR